ncbi:MAG TPA: PaaI family thioesterase [Marmoricola sp.]|nr:PaaI family thioesterase [Marmoricola sp.]
MDTPFLPRVLDLTDEQRAEEVRVFGGLADSVRRLADASLRTTIDPDRVVRLQAIIDEVTDELAADQIPGSFGVALTASGEVRGDGNAVVGLRNPIAVPLHVQRDPSRGRVEAQFHLGALYEGPPTCVHGGVVALILDQLSGEAASAGGAPGMTGTLTVRYRQPTPLGDCSASAWVDRIEGVKTIVHGEFRRADGGITASCEGIFVIPRAIRELIAKGASTPTRFE